MEAWESISKTTNYIEENLERKLSIEELSTIAYLSPFYFQKLFKRLVGTTVMEYVKFRRLAKIADRLKGDFQGNMIDLCMEYGFENQETFSRNFKEAYGMTPTEYKNDPIILSHFNKPDISLKYHIIDEDVPIIANGIVLEITHLTIENPKYFAGYVASGDLKAPAVDPLVDVWFKLHETKEKFDGYIQRGNEIGINLNLASRTNKVKYFAGAEVLSLEMTNEGLEKYTLDIGEYIVCKFEAEDFNTLITDTISKVYSYMFLWIKNKKLFTKVKHIAYELYYNSTSDSAYMELWIPLKNHKRTERRQSRIAGNHRETESTT